MVIGGKIAWIFHVSTGKPSTPTRDGSFRVWSKIAGFSSHHLYYPSFFDGQRGLACATCRRRRTCIRPRPGRVIKED